MSEAPTFSVTDAGIDELDAILAAEASDPAAPTPRVDLTCVRFTPELLEHIPREVAEQYGVLPVYARRGRSKKKKQVEPGVLYIASSAPSDAAILEDCSLCCGMTVRAFLADPKAIRRAIPVVYDGGQVMTDAPPPVSTVHRVPPPVPRPMATVPSAAPVRAPSMPELPLIRPTGAAPAAVSVASPAAVSEAAPAAIASTGAAPAADDRPRTLPPEDFTLDEALTNHAVSPSQPPAGAAAVASDEPPPSRPPRLLALSASEAMLAYCREALAPLGGIVDTCDMSRTGELGANERPRLLLVPEEIYPFDRRAFNLLAFELRVPLVVWSLDMDPSDLQSLLLASSRT